MGLCRQSGHFEILEHSVACVMVEGRILRTLLPELRQSWPPIEEMKNKKCPIWALKNAAWRLTEYGPHRSPRSAFSRDAKVRQGLVAA
jgi:hypothetical protein